MLSLLQHNMNLTMRKTFIHWQPYQQSFFFLQRNHIKKPIFKFYHILSITLIMCTFHTFTLFYGLMITLNSRRLILFKYYKLHVFIAYQISVRKRNCARHNYVANTWPIGLRNSTHLTINALYSQIRTYGKILIMNIHTHIHTHHALNTRTTYTHHNT